jgi:inosine-uridine nucleoside N-ribohydrolase
VARDCPVFIEADNGLGSPAGDVDDGFALAWALLSGSPIAGVGSVYGNTSEAWADRNNRAVGGLCGFSGPHLRGAAHADDHRAETTTWLVNRSEPFRVLALGPLTTLAAALLREPALSRRIPQIVLVGGNRSSLGRWPPVWPFEFNLVKDPVAARRVVDSGVPITVVPLDVARRMTITAADLAALPGPLGDHLRRHSRRWFRRARCILLSRTIRIWDLVAASAALRPALVRTTPVHICVHDNGWLEFGSGGRDAWMVESFDRDALWQDFVATCRAFSALSSPLAATANQESP